VKVAHHVKAYVTRVLQNNFSKIISLRFEEKSVRIFYQSENSFHSIIFSVLIGKTIRKLLTKFDYT